MSREKELEDRLQDARNLLGQWRGHTESTSRLEAGARLRSQRHLLEKTKAFILEPAPPWRLEEFCMELSDVDALKEDLRAGMLECGEFLEIQRIAEIVEQYHEHFRGKKFLAAQIVQARYAAEEEFLDSMIANERRTLKEGTIDAAKCESRIVRWEAIRPSRQRVERIVRSLEEVQDRLEPV